MMDMKPGEDEIAEAQERAAPAKRKRRRTTGAMRCRIMRRRPVRRRLPQHLRPRAGAHGTAVASMALSTHHRRMILCPEFRNLHCRVGPPLPQPHIAYIATAMIKREESKDPVGKFHGFHVAGIGLNSNAPIRSLTDVPHNDVRDGEISRKSLYIDGIIYLFHKVDYKKAVILAFDVDEETVTSINMPAEYRPTSQLLEISGRPCVETYEGESRALCMLTEDHRWEQRCVIKELISYYGQETGDLRFCSIAGVWDCSGVLVLYLDESIAGNRWLHMTDASTMKTFQVKMTPDRSSCAFCWGYRPTLLSPGSIVDGKLSQDEERRCRDGEKAEENAIMEAYIMEALKPVNEDDRREGHRKTLNTVEERCAVEEVAPEHPEGSSPAPRGQRVEVLRLRLVTGTSRTKFVLTCLRKYTKPGEDEIAKAQEKAAAAVRKRKMRRATGASAAASRDAGMCDDVVRSIFARVPARTAVASMALSKHHRRMILCPEFRSLHCRLGPPLPQPHIAYIATAEIRRRKDPDPISAFRGFHVAGIGHSSSNAPMRSLAGSAYLTLWNVNTRSQTYRLLLSRWRRREQPAIATKKLLVYALGAGGDNKSLRTVLSVGDGEISNKSLYLDGIIYLFHFEKEAILAFDVDEETVTSIKMPGNQCKPYYSPFFELQELSGRPCMQTYDGNSRALWLLREDHRWEQRCVIKELRSYYGQETRDLSVCSINGAWDSGGGVLVLYLNDELTGNQWLHMTNASTSQTLQVILPRNVTPEQSGYSFCWGYKPTLLSPESIVGKLSQDEERHRELTANIMEALKPVNERERRKGHKKTLNTLKTRISSFSVSHFH
ncbi:hypothetical protein EJB05_03861, partial [Eragrostis curvula]